MLLLLTRQNYYKLIPQHCRYDLRKYYFTNRVVPVWNSLPNDVVMADNINAFKNHLDISNLVFVKRRLNKVLRGASYE